MSANAKLNTNPIALVNNADYAVLVRAGKDKPVMLPGVRQAFITGGRRFGGNGYQSSAGFDGRRFSFGYDAPTMVEAVSKDGKKFSLTDVTRIMFCGGSDGVAPLKVLPPHTAAAGAGAGSRDKSAYDFALQRYGESLMEGRMNVATEDVIPDDHETHVLDNGAFQEIADYAPVYPNEMANSTESIDLDDPDYNGTDIESPTEDEGSRDEVLGGGMARGSSHQEVFRDDFVDTMHNAAKAAYGPNGELLDDFDQKFQQQQGEHADLGDAAPWTRINPVSVLRGLLGSQINMNPNLQPATVAYWVGNDESETLPVTVTFGTPQTLNQLQTINRLTARPYGIVQFGSRDMLLQAEVDIGRGTQFTVHGSSVTLQVAMDKATGVNTGIGNQQLGGMLSFYPTLRTAPVTRTRYIDVDTPFSIELDVPAFAKNVTFLGANGGDSVKLDFLDSFGVTVYVVEIDSPSSDSPPLNPILLSGDITSVIVDFSPNPLALSRLVFGLSL